MLVGPPRPDLGLRPFPWLNLPGAMGPDGSRCDPSRWKRRRSTWFPRWRPRRPGRPWAASCTTNKTCSAFGPRPKSDEVEFFRRYLQETYKDLDSLNASWGTAYTAWDEIDAGPAAINFVTQGDRNPAPWADWHAASEQAAHRFYAALDEAVRKAVPGTRIGPSGTRDTNGVNGIDWWLLARDFRSICLYHGIHDEMYRSFAAARSSDDRLGRTWATHSTIPTIVAPASGAICWHTAAARRSTAGATPMSSSPTIGPNRGSSPTPRNSRRSATVLGG